MGTGVRPTACAGAWESTTPGTWSPCPGGAFTPSETQLWWTVVHRNSLTSQTCMYRKTGSFLYFVSPIQKALLLAFHLRFRLQLPLRPLPPTLFLVFRSLLPLSSQFYTRSMSSCDQRYKCYELMTASHPSRDFAPRRRCALQFWFSQAPVSISGVSLCSLLTLVVPEGDQGELESHIRKADKTAVPSQSNVRRGMGNIL